MLWTWVTVVSPVSSFVIPCRFILSTPVKLFFWRIVPYLHKFLLVVPYYSMGSSGCSYGNNEELENRFCFTSPLPTVIGSRTSPFPSLMTLYLSVDIDILFRFVTLNTGNHLFMLVTVGHRWVFSSLVPLFMRLKWGKGTLLDVHRWQSVGP